MFLIIEKKSTVRSTSHKWKNKYEENRMFKFLRPEKKELYLSERTLSHLYDFRGIRCKEGVVGMRRGKNFLGNPFEFPYIAFPDLFLPLLGDKLWNIFDLLTPRCQETRKYCGLRRLCPRVFFSASGRFCKGTLRLRD